MFEIEIKHAVWEHRQQLRQRQASVRRLVRQRRLERHLHSRLAGVRS